MVPGAICACNAVCGACVAVLGCLVGVGACHHWAVVGGCLARGGVRGVRVVRAPLDLLQVRQSTWRLAGVSAPPRACGVMWSTSGELGRPAWW